MVASLVILIDFHRRAVWLFQTDFSFNPFRICSSNLLGPVSYLGLNYIEKDSDNFSKG